MALTVANLINIWDNASTSASSSWMSPNSDWDEEVNTPDLTPLLQEVMDYGWRDSVLMLVGNATEFTDEDQTTKVYDSYDGSWSQAPLLTVSYCTTTTTTGAFGRNPEQAVTCSFNNGKCQWFTPSGLKAWSLGSGPTLSSDTGPETGADGGHGWNRMKTGRAAFEKTLSIRLVQEKETKTCDYFIHSCLARRLSVFQFLSQTVLLCRFAVCICWSERERKPAVRAAKPRLLCNLFLAYDFFCVYLRRGHCKYEAWVSHIKLFPLGRPCGRAPFNNLLATGGRCTRVYPKTPWHCDLWVRPDRDSWVTWPLMKSRRALGMVAAWSPVPNPASRWTIPPTLMDGMNQLVAGSAYDATATNVLQTWSWWPMQLKSRERRKRCAAIPAAKHLTLARSTRSSGPMLLR